MIKQVAMKHISVVIFAFFFVGFPGTRAAHARQALNLEESQWRGQFGLESLLYLKPSGAAGTSRFQVPYAGFEGSFRFDHDLRAEVEVGWRSPVTAGQELTIERAAITRPLGDGGIQLRGGLFEPAWLGGAEDFWPYDRYSRDLGWAFERWGYLSAADYGFEIFKRSTEGGFGIAVVNGEGIRQNEQGPQKDFHVWAARNWNHGEVRRTELLFIAVRGGYENVPAVDAAKERAMLSLRSAGATGWLGGAEILLARDPADSVNGKIVDAVDLTDRGGERLAGRMLSLTAGYRGASGDDAPSAHALILRADAVEPVAGESARALTSTQLLYLYSSVPGEEWVFQVSNLDYGSSHSNSVRDENTWRIAYHVRWN